MEAGALPFQRGAVGSNIQVARQQGAAVEGKLCERGRFGQTAMGLVKGCLQRLVQSEQGMQDVAISLHGQTRGGQGTHQRMMIDVVMALTGGGPQLLLQSILRHGAIRAGGKVRVTQVPTPKVLDRWMAPPCSSIRDLTMGRPSPVPLRAISMSLSA